MRFAVFNSNQSNPRTYQPPQTKEAPRYSRRTPRSPSRTKIELSLVTLLFVSAVFSYAVVTFLDGVSWPILLRSHKRDSVSEFQTEIQCYSIPYGVIGFVSHILTFWSIVWLWYGHRPLLPWTVVDNNVWRWDLSIGIVGLLASVALSVYAMFRCRNSWQFELIACWKLCLSMTMGFTTMTTALEAKGGGMPEDDDEFELRISVFFSLIYGCGLVIGMVGLISLVKQSWGISRVSTITYAFAGIWIALFVLAFFLLFLTPILDLDASWAGTPFLLLPISIVLYSDWVLGAVAGNLIGTPSSDIAVVYWLYFAAKRLQMFTF